MKYLCLFDSEGTMIRPADSIVKLSREEEFVSAYDAYMRKESRSPDV